MENTKKTKPHHNLEQEKPHEETPCDHLACGHQHAVLDDHDGSGDDSGADDDDAHGVQSRPGVGVDQPQLELLLRPGDHEQPWPLGQPLG